jgi:hypothetical protein
MEVVLVKRAGKEGVRDDVLFMPTHHMGTYILSMENVKA